MVTELKRCPVCLSQDSAAFDAQSEGQRTLVDCERCGQYEITHTVLATEKLSSGATKLWRAALSHRLRLSQGGEKPPLIRSSWLSEYGEGPPLPSPAEQATNLIRAIGNHQRRGEGDLYLSVEVVALVGALDQASAYRICDELVAKKLVIDRGITKRPRKRGGDVSGKGWDLSLDGWERYELAEHGQRKGSYGFLALKFGDATLDAFVKDVLKPAVKTELKFDLVDMRDVGRAGLIDNIMRAQIRDAAFVIADLTHENAGAYWEAGYAEGLNKPVVYICERDKFEKTKTHFDTNHSTTVPWSTSEPQLFVQELVATLRRSLGLFDTR